MYGVTYVEGMREEMRESVRACEWNCNANRHVRDQLRFTKPVYAYALDIVHACVHGA